VFYHVLPCVPPCGFNLFVNNHASVSIDPPPPPALVSPRMVCVPHALVFVILMCFTTNGVCAARAGVRHSDVLMLLSLLPPTTRYERLLQKTSHVKVWISYADFEASLDDDAAAEQARHVYETAEKEVKKGGDKAQRLLLLESWRDFEADLGALFVVAPTHLSFSHETLRLILVRCLSWPPHTSLLAMRLRG
jgi:hypothetical protein